MFFKTLFYYYASIWSCVVVIAKGIIYISYVLGQLGTKDEYHCLWYSRNKYNTRYSKTKQPSQFSLKLLINIIIIQLAAKCVICNCQFQSTPSASNAKRTNKNVKDLSWKRSFLRIMSTFENRAKQKTQSRHLFLLYVRDTRKIRVHTNTF